LAMAGRVMAARPGATNSAKIVGPYTSPTCSASRAACSARRTLFASRRLAVASGV
jgi:hypothetical protein